jgi:hypothetical protein
MVPIDVNDCQGPLREKKEEKKITFTNYQMFAHHNDRDSSTEWLI